MTQQWHKGKLVSIGFAAAGLAILTGLALAYSSKPGREESDEGDTPAQETRNEEPDGVEVGSPPRPPRARPGPLPSTGVSRVWMGVV